MPVGHVENQINVVSGIKSPFCSGAFEFCEGETLIACQTLKAAVVDKEIECPCQEEWRYNLGVIFHLPGALMLNLYHLPKGIVSFTRSRLCHLPEMKNVSFARRDCIIRGML